MSNESQFFWDVQRYYKTETSEAFLAAGDLHAAITASAPLMLIRSGILNSSNVNVSASNFGLPREGTEARLQSRYCWWGHRAKDAIQGVPQCIKVLGGMHVRECIYRGARLADNLSSSPLSTPLDIQSPTVAWLNYDKLPQYDDEPHLESLETSGWRVLRPKDVSRHARLSWKTAYEYYQLYPKIARSVANELEAWIAGSRRNVSKLSEKIFHEYMEPHIRRSILRSVLVHAPAIQELAKAGKPLFVVSRNGANATFPLISVARESRDMGNVKLVLIPHSISTRRWLAGIAHFYSDLSLFPTKRSYEILGQSGADIIQRSETLPKPRHTHMRSVRIQCAQVPKSLYTVAITHPHAVNLSSVERQSIDRIRNEVANCGGRIVIKEKNPDYRNFPIYSVFRRVKQGDRLQDLVTRRTLGDLVCGTRVGFVIPNEEKRYISNIFLDFVASGVPVVIVVPDSAESIERYTNYDPAMAPLVYSSSEAAYRFVQRYSINHDELYRRVVDVMKNYFPDRSSAAVIEHFRKLL